MTLSLGLAALVAGPLMERALAGRKTALAALEGLVFVALAGMVLVHILPHSLALAGMGALGAAAVGLGLALALGRRLPSAAGRVLAVAGLAVHAVLEGRALSLHGEEGGALEALAVVLHRLPLGVGLWWLLRPALGALGTGGLLLGVALVGAAGFGWGGEVLGPDAVRGAAFFQALAAGAVLPALFRGRASAGHEGRAQRWAAGLGALAAVGLLAIISRAHPVLGAQPGELSAADTFLSLALETAPALLVAYTLSGLLQAFLGEASLGWLKRGAPLSLALRGTVVGLPLPLCSCGVVPVYRSLVLKGVPLTAALSFLVAAPEIGVSALLVSVPLLGWPLTLARLGAAFGVALLAGVLVGRWVAPRPAPASPPAGAAGPLPPLRERLAHGLRAGLVESVDHTAPWILVGLGLAALVEPLLAADWLARLPAGLDVPLFALLGMPSYVCASGGTPLVAVLLHKGLSPGAAVAFLLTGPATNITTFAVLARLHGRKVAAAFAGVVAVGSIGLGLAVNALMPAQAGLALHPAVEETGPLRWVGLALLGALFLASLLRQGPRTFLAQLLPGTSHGETPLPQGERLAELHVHGPSCGHGPHEHGPAHAHPVPVHVHGPGCSHGHAPAAPAHEHGPDCQHGAARPPGSQAG